jgi:hypothetical protein
LLAIDNFASSWVALIRRLESTRTAELVDDA